MEEIKKKKNRTKKQNRKRKTQIRKKHANTDEAGWYSNVKMANENVYLPLGMASSRSVTDPC